jgi:hypothetical protein
MAVAALWSSVEASDMAAAALRSSVEPSVSLSKIFLFGTASTLRLICSNEDPIFSLPVQLCPWHRLDSPQSRQLLTIAEIIKATIHLEFCSTMEDTIYEGCCSISEK